MAIVTALATQGLAGLNFSKGEAMARLAALAEA